MDRDHEIGLARIVEERRPKLIRVTDPGRPYRVLAHIIVDSVDPEYVPKLLPKGVVTVREAARILSDLADRSRVTPRGAPVVMDREMLLFVRKSIFVYFVHLLTFDRYDQADEKPEAEDGMGEIEVRFSDRGIFVSRAAMLRWTAIILEPNRFEIVSEFLRTVKPDEYRTWYFRILAAAVGLKEIPDDDALRLLIRKLREPRIMN
ncbi:hypothetical protein HZC53_00595 [Candidatus Uhrbacteria bacterium]|nr:hypothetical protein [Candidatus Uhrbacteria bacterium]